MAWQQTAVMRTASIPAGRCDRCSNCVGLDQLFGDQQEGETCLLLSDQTRLVETCCFVWAHACEVFYRPDRYLLCSVSSSWSICDRELKIPNASSLDAGISIIKTRRTIHLASSTEQTCRNPLNKPSPAQPASWWPNKKQQAACDLPDAAERGITLPQLQLLVDFAAKMANKWCETTGDHAGSPLEFKTFNFYHANVWIIKPATEGYNQTGCSLVEILNEEVQRPSWFVSHAWIEPWLKGYGCLNLMCSHILDDARVSCHW